MADPAEVARWLEILSSKYAATAYRNGLRPAQWQALRYFAAAESGQRGVSAFAAWRGSTNGSASVLVSKLVERGYLARRETGLSRNVDLRITEAGKRALREDPFEELKAAADSLPHDERDAVLRALVRMADRLAGETGDHGSG